MGWAMGGIGDAKELKQRQRFPSSLRFAAHSLKGSSANLGASGVAEVAKHLEHSARDGNIDGLEATLAELHLRFAEADTEFRRITGLPPRA